MQAHIDANRQDYDVKRKNCMQYHQLMYDQYLELIDAEASIGGIVIPMALYGNAAVLDRCLQAQLGGRYNFYTIDHRVCSTSVRKRVSN